MRSMWPGVDRLRTAVLLGFLLLNGALADVAAQADGTPIAAAPGTLSVAVVSCADGAADPEIVDAAPDCPPGGAASLWIDGAGPSALDDGGSVSLDVGDHTVATSETGSGITVSITSGETARIIVVVHF